MEQSTTPKPVMDVMPPKPAAPTQPAESELVGGSEKAGPASDALTVHVAPPLSDEDKAEAESNTTSAKQTEQQKSAAHTAPPKPHGPAGAITLVILGMIMLSALAILVYLNS